MTQTEKRNILASALLGLEDEGRKNWLAERKTGIGGSDAAAVLGLSPWATPVTVWLDKTGKAPAKPSSLRMAFGSINEEDVALMYEIKSDRKVVRYTRMIHQDCLLGNIDRLVIPEGEKIAAHQGEIRTDTLLECKCSDRTWLDGVPAHYLTQVQHYMGLTKEITHADVACYFRQANSFEVFRVERDQVVIDYMQRKLRDWWQEYVVGGKMPPPTNEQDCRLLWARSNPGKSILANEDIADLLDTYMQEKADEKQAKENAAKIQSTICAYMGDAEILSGINGKPLLTWKSAKDSNKTDWEGLARSLGATDAQIAAFTRTEAGSRRFIVKAETADLRQKISA